jgi:hypothetical protein
MSPEISQKFEVSKDDCPIFAHNSNLLFQLINIFRRPDLNVIYLVNDTLDCDVDNAAAHTCK